MDAETAGVGDRAAVVRGGLCGAIPDAADYDSCE